MSIQAYQRASVQAEAPRDTEYRVFAMVTSGLLHAKAQGRGDLQGLAAALDKNRRLWSMLAHDCGGPHNTLPRATRAQIISLALWVSRQSSAVMREGADIETLIEVNRSIMQGLAVSAS